MTIVSSLDYTPTLRDRQEFAVMSVLEDAIKGDEPIATSILADLIMDAIEDLAFDEEVSRADAA